MSTVNLTVPHYGKDTVYVATVFSSTSYVFSLHAVVVDMNKRLSLLIQFTVSTLNNYNTKYKRYSSRMYLHDKHTICIIITTPSKC